MGAGSGRKEVSLLDQRAPKSQRRKGTEAVGGKRGLQHGYLALVGAYNVLGEIGPLRSRSVAGACVRGGRFQRLKLAMTPDA